MNNCKILGIVNKNGEHKEFSWLEYPWKCKCGNDMFTIVCKLQKITPEDKAIFTPKDEYYKCDSCGRIYN